MSEDFGSGIPQDVDPVEVAGQEQEAADFQQGAADDAYDQEIEDMGWLGEHQQALDSADTPADFFQAANQLQEALTQEYGAAVAHEALMGVLAEVHETEPEWAQDLSDHVEEQEARTEFVGELLGEKANDLALDRTGQIVRADNDRFFG